MCCTLVFLPLPNPSSDAGHGCCCWETPFPPAQPGATEHLGQLLASPWRRMEDDVPQAKLWVAFFGNHFQTVPYGSAADAGLQDPPAEALEVPHTGHFLLVALNWS